jgi:hypothetical protein
MSTKHPAAETVTVGPFTWSRNEDTRNGGEHWTLENAVALIGCTWYLQDYGVSYPGSPFTGWKCGSGGPWPTQYKGREDAMNRVIPYLLERMQERIVAARAALAELERVHAETTKLLAAA